MGNAAVVPPVTFRNDVMPVFARTGCNMGSCHGAARGKDGFRLSLFGFDPAGDHFRLTREMAGRRLNLGVPDRSLLYEKSVGAVSHTGGKRFEPGSEYGETILEWIAAGATDDAAVPACTELQLFPPKLVLAGAGSGQRTVARAVYADGTDRDVTHLVAFNSSNPPAAAVGPDGGRGRRRNVRHGRGGGVPHGPVRRAYRGRPRRGPAGDLPVRLAGPADAQLCRRAGRRETENLADRPQRTLHRRGVRPPGPPGPRRRRPAGGPRPGIRRLDRPGQAGGAGGRAAFPADVRGPLGDEVV